MPTIGLFDLDGSLANHDEALLRDISKIAAPNDNVVTGENFWKLDELPYMKARFDLIRNQPGWWLSLNPIEKGMKIFHAAKEIGFCCNVLTKGPKSKPLAWKEKLEWCHKYLGDEHHVHVTMNKGIVYGKFLYDDYPDYMTAWLEHRPRGLGIMPVTESNKDFNHPNVIKYDGDNYEEVVTALRLCYKRKTGEPLELRCSECNGKGWKFVVCYALGVISCPKCGDPNDKPGQTYNWHYDENGIVVVKKGPYVPKSIK
ncbi:hypothetical protein C4577_05045 [Candidatus Parcubacteria bacterium]|nr:MAG: hypothetical protein C4577_05045 [Candidatus Parcubacteria bacterium]